MKYWLGDENFPQRKIFADEIFPFMRVSNIFGPPPKRLSTSFSAVTPTNVEIRATNFMTFSFNFLPHLCKISRQELPNFSHMATSIIQFESRDKILLMTSWTEIK